MISLSLRAIIPQVEEYDIVFGLFALGFMVFLPPHDANEVLSSHNSVANSRQLVICGTAVCDL